MNRAPFTELAAGALNRCAFYFGLCVVGPAVGLVYWLRRVLMAAAWLVLVLLEPVHGLGLVLLHFFKIGALQALCWIFEKHYARLFRALSTFDRG